MNWIDYRTAVPFNYSRENIEDLPEQAIVTVSADERGRLFEASLKIPYNPYRMNEQEKFISEAKKLSDLLSSESRKLIDHELYEGYGAVLISGLPMDPDLPDTPEKGGSLSPEYKKTFVTEAMLMAFGNLTNTEPFNFRQEGWGMAPLIDNIVPVLKLKDQRGAGGYSNDFPFHCESTWHRKRPDFLILAGIRSAQNAKTLVFSANQLKGTKWYEEAGKMEGKFRLKAPDLYLKMEAEGIPMGTPHHSSMSPLAIKEGMVELNLNFNGIDCIDQDSVDWMHSLEQFIEDNSVGTILQPGSLLILNNSRTCHTRTGYIPDFNKKDRWFIRGYFKRDLWVGVNLDMYHADKQFFNELLACGWTDAEGKLTKEFLRYVFEYKELEKLDGKMQQLAQNAFGYTPVTGSRIV
ncbi:TauD/TfdA family dioxygenase [Fulvivirga sp. 29W222]|uniref:TauD/TfdA family dioxygenase n=1 Tax=Fulvivirga marina TaxID=2494733 RepID=A0A937G6I4_9BACT|nr:TauD/TfdA family dioxygenase [Fulvivirga marina]MBL6449336.1 TauD/TfdA family dioxygenase [Fulvivirga marina]